MKEKIPNKIKDYTVLSKTPEITLLPGDLINIKDVAKLLNYNYKYFLLIRSRKGFPKPIKTKRFHRIYYSYKDIKDYIEKFKK